MLTVDGFTVDDSVVDDSIMEVRDFVTDSKAFTNSFNEYQLSQ